MNAPRKCHFNKLMRPDTSKTKFLDFEFDLDSYQIKSANGKVSVEGYANTVDRDRVKEIVLPKAFEKSLAVYLDNPVLLYQHDWDMPIGKVIQAVITEKGLWIKAEISNAKDVEDVRTKISEGILKTFSIGYNEIKSRFDEKAKCKIVEELELLEISVVTIPANTEAKFTVVIPEEGKGDDVTVIVSKGVTEVIGDNEIIPELIKLIQSKQEKCRMDPKSKPATPEIVPATEPKAAPAAAPDEAVPAAPVASDDSENGDVLKLLKALLEKVDALAAGLKAMAEKPSACEPGKEPKPGEEKPKAADPGQTPEDNLTDEQAEDELEKVTSELEALEG
jgi:HK97 family phage prohead protease